MGARRISGQYLYEDNALIAVAFGYFERMLSKSMPSVIREAFKNIFLNSGEKQEPGSIFKDLAKAGGLITSKQLKILASVFSQSQTIHQIPVTDIKALNSV